MEVWRGRFALWLGRFSNRLGLPGQIRSVDVHDPVFGGHLSVAVGPLFTRVSVDGRDYYFHRFSGVFDGTGGGRL